MRRFLFALLLLPLPLNAEVYQGDPAIGAGLAAAFGAQTEVLDSYLFPDDADPAKATEAVGIVYTVIEGAAGNFNIDAGVFQRAGDGYGLLSRVEIYGTDPRDVQFLPDRWVVTTTMPKPDDPRCCPTGTTDWSIMRGTFQVVRTDR